MYTNIKCGQSEEIFRVGFFLKRNFNYKKNAEYDNDIAHPKLNFLGFKFQNYSEREKEPTEI